MTDFRGVVREYQPRRGQASRWVCDCDCGAVSTVRTGDLNSGSVRTCGAVHHQLEESAEYKAAHDRSGRRCPRCRALLVYAGESYTNPDGDRAFLWTHTEWREFSKPDARRRQRRQPPLT